MRPYYYYFFSIIEVAPNLGYLSSNFKGKSRQYRNWLLREHRKGGPAIISDRNIPWQQARGSLKRNVSASGRHLLIRHILPGKHVPLCAGSGLAAACYHSNFPPHFMMGRCCLTCSRMRSVSILPEFSNFNDQYLKLRAIFCISIKWVCHKQQLNKLFLINNCP